MDMMATNPKIPKGKLSRSSKLRMALSMFFTKSKVAAIPCDLHRPRSTWTELLGLAIYPESFGKSAMLSHWVTQPNLHHLGGGEGR